MNYQIGGCISGPGIGGGGSLSLLGQGLYQTPLIQQLPWILKGGRRLAGSIVGPLPLPLNWLDPTVNVRISNHVLIVIALFS